MKIFEGYNMAEKEYGQEVAEIMKQNGIPKNFIQAACRFHIKEGVPVEQLQNDWKMWNRYVLMNPQYKDNTGHNKNLATMSYKDFKAEIQNFQQPYLCPNPIYDDGILSIGECKTQRDARWFPLQNLAYPEENNDFCICKKAGGFMKFLGYKSQGYRILLIYDKSRSASDPYKRMGVLVKDGVLSFWDNYDKPCGTTKYTNDPIWRYIDSLPTKAQLALSEFAEGKITESKSNKNMKTKKRTITESQLRKIVAESVKYILKESYRNGVFGGQLTVSELISELQKMPQDVTVCFHSPRENGLYAIECLKFVEKSHNRSDDYYGEDYDKVILYSDSKYVPEDKPMFPDDHDRRVEDWMWRNAYENMPNN